nr:acyl-CoA dehydrogenase family protein [Halomonas sp. PGE1]
MNLTYSAEEQAFRQDVRDFLATSLPDDIRERVRLGRRLTADDHLRWQTILSERGWLAANWPEAHGGARLGPGAATYLRRGVCRRPRADRGAVWHQHGRAGDHEIR